MADGVAARRSTRGLPAIASALLVLLAGCGDDGFEGEGGPVGTTHDEQVICEGPVTVPGIDVSVYQGSIDWDAVKASGKEFAIARVSDGLFKDTRFDQNWPAMKAAGVLRGAYQFFEPGVDPSAQADLIIQKVGVLGPGDLPCMLDVEATGNQSPATITAHIHTWIDEVTAATGRAPIIYTGKYFWNGNVQSADFADLMLVIAAYGPPCPDTPSAWDRWGMWQYSSTGQVPGISGNVDLDKFNGTLQDLQKLAGMNPDYAAKYVDQSFPLAVDPLVMTVNQSIPATLTLKNVGKKAWDDETRLGTTQPRDRSSDFFAPDWLAPNRPAGVTGTVQPGEDYKFSFTFKAPDKPGTYYEYFGVLEEGVTWFSDPGQGGPADDQIEAQIQVIAAEYHGQWVDQSFPSPSDPAVELEVGQTLEGWVELKNLGTATWKAGETKLAPTPRDQPSPLGASSWLSKTRVSTVTSDVPPGEVGHFPLSITATKKGDFTQAFGLVEEGVTWFADAPKGGGPSDDALALHVVVSPKGGHADDPSTPEGDAKSGCGCRVAGGPEGGSAMWLAALAGLVVARRKRFVSAR